MKSNEKTPQERVDDFNDLYPINTPLKVKDEQGDIWIRRTRSKAWVLPSGMPVVQFERLSGCYLIDQVIKIQFPE